jgi:hypothetical protein
MIDCYHALMIASCRSDYADRVEVAAAGSKEAAHDLETSW